MPDFVLQLVTGCVCGLYCSEQVVYSVCVCVCFLKTAAACCGQTQQYFLSNRFLCFWFLVTALFDSFVTAETEGDFLKCFCSSLCVGYMLSWQLNKVQLQTEKLGSFSFEADILKLFCKSPGRRYSPTDTADETLRRPDIICSLCSVLL